MLKKILALVAFCCAAASFAAVDVNKATADELNGIKGIGPSLSGKILEERKNGPYKDWGDLKQRVKGIGEKNAAKLSDAGLTVGGKAYGSSQSPASQGNKEKDRPAGNKVPQSKPATDTKAASTPAKPAQSSEAGKKAK